MNAFVCQCCYLDRIILSVSALRQYILTNCHIRPTIVRIAHEHFFSLKEMTVKLELL